MATTAQIEWNLINEMGIDPRGKYTQTELRSLLSVYRYKAKQIDRPGTTDRLLEVANDMLYSYQYGSRSGNLKTGE